MRDQVRDDARAAAAVTDELAGEPPAEAGLKSLRAAGRAGAKPHSRGALFRHGARAVLADAVCQVSSGKGH